MSKSGLFAHFGSREDLQLATVEAAREIFIREVIRPAYEAAQGLERLWRAGHKASIRESRVNKT